MLGILGLNADGEEMYRAMLQQPGKGVVELAESLGWSVERTRTAMDALAQLALVQGGDTSGRGMMLVNPSVGLSSLLTQEEAQLARRAEEIANGRRAVNELISAYNEWSHVHRGVDIERLTGLDEIRMRLKELTYDCRSDLVGFAPGGPQTDDNRSAARPLDKELIERGVHMRTLYLHSARSDAATAEHLDWLVSIGARIRTTATLPMRMIIFDRQTAMVPLNPEDSAAGAVVLHGRGLVDALYALFEHVWQQATPHGTAPGVDPATGLTSQARAVLSLLAQGNTDEAVARKLGISVRTSRRITAELMERLGARSRFQAGVIAGEQGWLQGARNRAGAGAQT
ncbi:LuxR C-terminal-related transcriptional regulator [Streptomyces odontomachi]|uniref:LuxR C-terminal-related transcriptional regulator n=1 Tax=Streptomyces odontomachi TaxID=2944940 RepID=UPI00210B9E95|nr:helix-turn-helix transcriptional regulator [Streptomyces sp. ODS25]